MAFTLIKGYTNNLSNFTSIFGLEVKKASRKPSLQ